MEQQLAPAQGAALGVALRMTDVVKSFGAVRALKGVSFEVRPGEVHALVGENGAGKSTLMAIAAGSLRPDSGRVELCGEAVERTSPMEIRRRGLAVVYQHPALLGDLTITENLLLSLSADSERPGLRAQDDWARAILAEVALETHPQTRVSELTVQERHLVEIAKALAARPRVLILDEPTEPLVAEEIERLFEKVRAVAAAGTAVVYISHRIPDVQRISDRITVLRDGETRGTMDVEDVTEADIVRLIVGREVAYVLPQKPPPPPAGKPVFEVRGLTRRPDFEQVDLRVARGEIVGLAGVSGNGQEELMRALAGLGPSRGEVLIDGKPRRIGSPEAARRAGVAYVPADRLTEGAFKQLSVRENLSLGGLGRYARHGVVDPRREREGLRRRFDEMSIRAPSPAAPITALSGGNQQKVVLGRALERDPAVLLAHEPTQGVDVGARAEIYEILRSVAADGRAVLLVSTDAIELAGLCDRVLIFSRGHVVAELSGDEVDEAAITNAALTSTTVRARDDAAPRSQGALRRFLRGDYAPAAALTILVALLALYTQSVADRYLGAQNLTNVLLLLAGFAFIAYGQQLVMLLGGIDLSVGPLSGLIVVVASFFFYEAAAPGTAVLGILAIVGVALAVGILHYLLIRVARVHAVAATLATYIAIQGISLILRPQAEGPIAVGVLDALSSTVGWLPIAFLVAVGLAVALELWLRTARTGIELRAVGSDEKVAHAAGAKVWRANAIAYVGASLLTLLGGVMLMAQTGVGDPTGGVTFTLTSIVAVVLGGAAITGGRGSFVGVLCGAALLQQSTNMIPFLGLTQEWTQWLPGILILAAAALYTAARTRGAAR